MKRVMKMMIPLLEQGNLIFLILLSGMRHLSLNCTRRKGWQMSLSTVSSEKHCHLDMCLLMMKSGVSSKHVRWEWSGERIKNVRHKSFSAVQPTDTYEWIRHLPSSDGRLIHQTLVAHYEGEFQSQTIQNAHTTIAATGIRLSFLGRHSPTTLPKPTVIWKRMGCISSIGATVHG
jgi:hypothetical protein